MRSISPAILLAIAALATVPVCPGQVRAELRGHGGPVRGLAVLQGGAHAISGGFDQSIIVWDLSRDVAARVLRFHDGAVNAIAPLSAERFASGGEDGRVALWQLGEDTPYRSWRPHRAAVAGLALSADGTRLLSASWDGTAQVIDVATGAAVELSGHQGPVNAAAFLPGGRAVTAGTDGALRIWPDEVAGALLLVKLPGAVNAIAITGGGEIAVGGADGALRLVRDDGTLRMAAELEAGPILALAASPDRARLAAGTLAGAALVLEVSSGAVVARLLGPGVPVWSVAFSPDGREVLTGGGDGVVRRWDLQTGEQVGSVAPRGTARPAVLDGERGAELSKACIACHTLGPEGGNRAGPTLHGIFGRRIATAPGYPYSEALRRLDIVWNAETVSKLFEIGPSRFTPGTKMPEQTVAAGDREALVRYLERATRPSP